ncbi:MAG: hypothetical protein K8H86_09510 [Ignavibacteriaceae bacterium]|nr:hypothetical protein [Ignavibacteriaceae bacterium]
MLNELDKIIINALEVASAEVKYFYSQLQFEVYKNNLDTIESIAETGVDYISVGALRHSVNALDISLKINAII